VPIPDPTYLSAGDNAWQLTAATLVGLMSVPGLAVLYGGLAKRKFAVNSAMMVLYAFAAVLIVWVLWGYQMSFGNPLNLGSGLFSGLVGAPRPVLSALSEEGQAHVPLLRGLIPSLRFPSASLVYFQFVFAAITPALLAGGILGRMNFKAWLVFVPAWSTFVYSVNAFMLWGGGWLAQMGAVDYSGGYVIHVAAGVSGFVAAWIIGPRRVADREAFRANNLLLSLVGAGILWLGWNGFNGGDPYFANADAAVAVLNTNLATAVAVVTWMILDMQRSQRASLSGAINGMVAGLVAITPAAGYIDGLGALLIGLAAGAIPWMTMNLLAHSRLFRKVDDTLGVIHTHAIAGAVGGLLVGVLADPHIIVYPGSRGHGPVIVTGWAYGNPHQVLVQLLALIVIVGFDGAMTAGILKGLALVMPLRTPDLTLQAGDREMHGEEVYDDPIQPVPGHHSPPSVPAFQDVGRAAVED
jgi:Amt family ammonium transporter